MPRTFHILAAAASMPDLSMLQAAIKSLKFKLTLDEAYQPFETQGYLPCTVEGEDAGVDMRFESGIQGQGARDARMTLKWSGDPREHLSALVIAAAMATSFDALVLDPDKEAELSTASLLKQARAIQEESF